MRAITRVDHARAVMDAWRLDRGDAARRALEEWAGAAGPDFAAEVLSSCLPRDVFSAFFELRRPRGGGLELVLLGPPEFS